MRGSSRSPPQHQPPPPPPPESPLSFRAASEANTAVKQLHLRSPPPSPPSTPPQAHTSLRRSSSLSGSRSLSHTVETAAGTSPASASASEAERKQSADRKEKVEAGADAESDATSLQPRLYKPEVRSCGHPQPLYLRVPVERKQQKQQQQHQMRRDEEGDAASAQRSPVVSKEQRSVLYLATPPNPSVSAAPAAAAGVRLQEDSPVSHAARREGQAIVDAHTYATPGGDNAATVVMSAVPPASVSSSFSSSTPSVPLQRHSGSAPSHVNEKESTRGTNNAGVYVVESARVSAATESLAEQPLPSLPDATSLAPHHTVGHSNSGDEGREEEEGEEEDRMQTVAVNAEAPAGGAATAQYQASPQSVESGGTAAAADEDEQHGEGSSAVQEAQMMPQPYMPSSVTVRRFNHLRASDSSASSDSLHAAAAAPSETERTIDVDPPLTEHADTHGDENNASQSEDLHFVTAAMAAAAASSPPSPALLYSAASSANHDDREENAEVEKEEEDDDGTAAFSSAFNRHRTGEGNNADDGERSDGAGHRWSQPSHLRQSSYHDHPFHSDATSLVDLTLESATATTDRTGRSARPEALPQTREEMTELPHSAADASALTSRHGHLLLHSSDSSSSSSSSSSEEVVGKHTTVNTTRAAAAAAAGVSATLSNAREASDVEELEEISDRDVMEADDDDVDDQEAEGSEDEAQSDAQPGASSPAAATAGETDHTQGLEHKKDEEDAHAPPHFPSPTTTVPSSSASSVSRELAVRESAQLPPETERRRQHGDSDASHMSIPSSSSASHHAPLYGPQSPLSPQAGFFHNLVEVLSANSSASLGAGSPLHVTSPQLISASGFNRLDSLYTIQHSHTGGSIGAASTSALALDLLAVHHHANAVLNVPPSADDPLAALRATAMTTTGAAAAAAVTDSVSQRRYTGGESDFSIVHSVEGTDLSGPLDRIVMEPEDRSVSPEGGVQTVAEERGSGGWLDALEKVPSQSATVTTHHHHHQQQPQPIDPHPLQHQQAHHEVGQRGWQAQELDVSAPRSSADVPNEKAELGALLRDKKERVLSSLTTRRAKAIPPPLLYESSTPHPFHRSNDTNNSCSDSDPRTATLTVAALASAAAAAAAEEEEVTIPASQYHPDTGPLAWSGDREASLRSSRRVTEIYPDSVSYTTAVSLEAPQVPDRMVEQDAAEPPRQVPTPHEDAHKEEAAAAVLENTERVGETSREEEMRMVVGVNSDVDSASTFASDITAGLDAPAEGADAAVVKADGLASDVAAEGEEKGQPAVSSFEQGSGGGGGRDASAASPSSSSSSASVFSAPHVVAEHRRAAGDADDGHLLSTSEKSDGSVGVRVERQRDACNGEASDGGAATVETVATSRQPTDPKSVAAHTEVAKVTNLTPTTATTTTAAAAPPPSPPSFSFPSHVTHTVDAYSWPSTQAAGASPLHTLLGAISARTPRASLSSSPAAAAQTAVRRPTARELLDEEVEELSEVEFEEYAANSGEGGGEAGQQQQEGWSSGGGAHDGVSVANRTAVVAEAETAQRLVEHARATVAAADLRVLVDVEREGRQRLLLEMLDERAMILRDETAAFTVLSLMTRHTPERETAARTSSSPPLHHLQNNNSNPTSPSASSSQQQQGNSGPQRKVRTSVQLLLPPSPPAPTSREEVQALLRIRGVPDGVSLHVVSAAVMTDELLHRELIEEHEVQTRTLLRRLRQCVLDALWPTHLVAQEALAWQSIVEDARCEAQRIRSRENTVDEEIAGLRSVARELALCRMAEEEERSDVIARAEVAGRQRLRDLHLIGLAERLRQSAALMTVAAAAPASAQLRSELDDVCFDEAQEREEVRVAAIRAWTAVVASPSGAAVRAFLAQQQQQDGDAREQMPYQHEKQRLASRATTPATADAAGKTESEDTPARSLGKAPHAAREDEGEENAQAAAQHSQSSSTSSSSSSSSSSVSLSVASSLSFESIDHEPAMPEDTVDDGPQFFQWDPTSNSAPTPHDSNSRPSASQIQGSHRDGDHQQQQQQHSTSSPSPHLTNMTTLTNTANTTATTTSSNNNNKSHHDNTTATPSASVLLQGKSHEDADEKEKRRKKKKKRSSTGLSGTTSSSGGKAAAAVVTSSSSQQRSPTLVLPTAERLGNRDTISAAEASALLHALRRAEEDARELRQQQQQQRSSRHAAAKAVKSTEDSLSHQQHQQKDEEESSGAILDATMSDEKDEEKEGGVDAAGEGRDRAVLLHAHPRARSAHRAPTPPKPPPSSSCFISRHSVPCSLRHSPSQSYRALLRKYSPSPGHPHSEAHDDSHHHTGNNNNKDDVQTQQRASSRRWAGRQRRSSSMSSTSPRRYADADVYRYDLATTAGARLPTAGSRRHSASAQRRAAAVRVPWDRSVRIDPLIQDAEPLEPEPLPANKAATQRCDAVRSTSARGQARATATALDAPSVANTSTLTVMPTPAREVFPPLRTGADDTTTVSPTRTKGKMMVKGNNGSGGQAHSPSSSMMMLHEQSTPQRVQQQQPSLIEVITDSCIPRTFVASSLHDDVSVSSLTSHRSPSRSLLGYAAPTEAWQSQAAQRQAERRVREALQKEQEEMRMMTSCEKERREEGDEVDEASMKVMMSHARGTSPSSHSGVYDGGDTAEWRRSRCGHSRRRSPETAGGPLLITRLPFDHGPGVWPSPLYERDLYQVENPSHTHHRTTAQMSKEENGRSSRQQQHHHQQHVVATTRPSHSSAQRTRGVTSAPSAAAAAALEDALAQVVRTGEVVRLPTTVAALISGPMHTRLPLSTLHTTHGEGDNDNGAAVLWRDGSDGNASGGDDECDHTRGEGEEVGSKHGRSSQQRQHPLVSPAPSPQTTSRSSYSYVDVFYRQPHQAAAAAAAIAASPRSSPSLARTQQERRRMSESPNRAVRLPNPTTAQAAVETAEMRFIEKRCAAVQEEEAKHRLRMLLQPQPRRSVRVSTAGAVGEEGEEEESRRKKSDQSGFLYGQRTQRNRRDGLEGDVYDSASRLGAHRQRHTASAQQLAEGAEDGESYFDHEDVILCSAMANCALRQRTSAQQQQHKNRQPRQQQQYGSPSHAMGRSRQPPAQQRVPAPRQQKQQRASPPSSSSPPSSRFTSGFMDIDVPPGYRVLPAPSPSYLLVRTPPAAAPSSAQPSARGWIDAPTPPSPAYVHATAGGVGPVVGSANPYTTRGLYFDTSRLQRKINGA